MTNNEDKQNKDDKEVVEELMKQVYEEQKRIHPEIYEKPKEDLQ